MRINRFPTTDKWMKYAIRRANQITQENDIYQFDTQRVQMYYNELVETLSDEQKELLDEYQDHVQMKEDELALAIYIAAFEDVLRILQNVSFVAPKTSE